jgi:phosphopantetheinyl transferase (holo-ACP synthase)
MESEERIAVLHSDHVRNAARHAAALNWRSGLEMAHGLVWITRQPPEGAAHESYRRDRAQERLAVVAALRSLLQETLALEVRENDFSLYRDPLGKPCLRWSASAEALLRSAGLKPERIHISNTHDGDYHVVIAAYSPQLAGVGIDLVALSRLGEASKDRRYLNRLARRFMSDAEYARAVPETTAESDDRFRLRVAAHFSLMEAASKALGTGLKVGAGMGTEYSVPMKSIAVAELGPPTTLEFEGPAADRMAALNVGRVTAGWSYDEECVVSFVGLESV